jgi:NitT/TauT family transport system substrate-binding protein
MCSSVELVNTYMGLPKQVDCKAVFTNDFLTKVDLPVPVK